jgi:hypothetical protein
MTPASRHRLLLIAGLLGALLLTGLVAFQFAVHALKGQIEQSLGPHGEVREMRVGAGGVEILGVRIRAPRGNEGTGWPAEDQLRAERILVVPSLRDLFSASLVIRRIRIEGGYLSILRTRKGEIRVLPSLLPPAANSPESTASAAAPAVRIERLELAGSAVELFDASVRQPAHLLRIESIDADLSDLRFPALDGTSEITARGMLKGTSGNGRLDLSGRIVLASKASTLALRLRNVDLQLLQPYLIKATETGVRRGTLDLDLDSTVSQGRLRAPGHLTLNGLELASGSGSFMGLPRNAVISLMKDKSGWIGIRFVLEGDLEDPRFSFNENLMTRAGSALAENLGISLEGLARGVGSAGGGMARGIGESVEKLLGR